MLDTARKRIQTAMFCVNAVFVILQIFGVKHEVSLILFSQMDERSQKKNSQGAETRENGTQKAVIFILGATSD